MLSVSFCSFRVGYERDEDKTLATVLSFIVHGNMKYADLQSVYRCCINSSDIWQGPHSCQRGKYCMYNTIWRTVWIFLQKDKAKFEMLFSKDENWDWIKWHIWHFRHVWIDNGIVSLQGQSSNIIDVYKKNSRLN